MERNVRLTLVDYDQEFNQQQGVLIVTDITSYKCLIGKLLYLTITRPDISYSVQQFS